ncbi:MAG: potassium-transporting ATPase subunit C [Phycisphaerales bacterium]|nr:MAG: potassium-transporting ATPase subunit C [Phycisphaerales bacterium]
MFTSLRIAALSIVVCVIGYGTIVLGSAMLIAPDARLGGLVIVDGAVVGSGQIAQAFTRPEYLWPRPSAVNYAASATGGSNLSPASPVIRERAEGLLAKLGATPERPAPAELLLASGSGIDPHITETAALYQADRIAVARGIPANEVRHLIAGSATPIGPGDPARILNVLLFNIELDRRFPIPASGK